MRKEQILPTVLIVVDVFGYITTGVWKVIYWLAAAVLTASVTY